MANLLNLKADVSNADALINLSEYALASGTNAIRGVGLDFEDVTGWLAFQGNSDTGFRYAAYFQQETDNDAKMLGIGVFPFIQSGGASDRMQCVSTVMTVSSGGELESRGGDAVAGAHNFWGKFSADLSGATITSGARIAPFWSDIQVNNGDVSGEEVFHFFGSAGGSRARAFLYMEGQQSVYFFESDSSLGEAMLASTGYEACNNNAQAGFLKVYLNGTAYGIPLMAAS